MTKQGGKIILILILVFSGFFYFTEVKAASLGDIVINELLRFQNYQLLCLGLS